MYSLNSSVDDSRTTNDISTLLPTKKPSGFGIGKRKTFFEGFKKQYETHMSKDMYYCKDGPSPQQYNVLSPDSSKLAKF